MHKGTVKFFNAKTKFGFIIDDETKKEYYVHVKDIIEPIQQNDSVLFELKDSTRGKQCIQVKKVKVD